jgi:hypothetical protein
LTEDRNSNRLPRSGEAAPFIEWDNSRGRRELNRRLPRPTVKPANGSTPVAERGGSANGYDIQIIKVDQSCRRIRDCGLARRQLGHRFGGQPPGQQQEQHESSTLARTWLQPQPDSPPPAARSRLKSQSNREDGQREKELHNSRDGRARPPQRQGLFVCRRR